MLSYQHSYHAGNLADIHKHAALAWVLSYLLKKPKPLSYIESHSGRGLYDLTSRESVKTGEAEAGITANEPDQVALQQAIEKAVYGLILEGVELGLWNFSDMMAAGPLMQTYRAERDGIYDADDVQRAVRRAGSVGALTVVRNEREDRDEKEDES